MKIGIKFCGGCNPRYDRKKLKETISKECKQATFEYVLEGERYDHLIVIGGCTNNCASYEQYNVDGNIYKISEEEKTESIISKIKENF